MALDCQEHCSIFCHILELLPFLFHPFFIFRQGLYVGVLAMRVPVAEWVCGEPSAGDQGFTGDSLPGAIGQI